jgi:hypothetical protein
MTEFRISLSDNFIEFEDASTADILRDEVTYLQGAIHDFVEKYGQTEWFIHIGTKVYKCWIDDLLSIWDDLPDYLARVSINQGNINHLDLINQGSEKVIIVENKSDTMLWCSVLAMTDNPNFYDVYYNQSKINELKLTKYEIHRKQFIDEWKQFISTIIKLLIDNKLLSRDDNSIKEYLDSLS